jgi:hypothetical protein
MSDRDDLIARLDELEDTITVDDTDEYQIRREVVGHDGDVIDTQTVTFEVGGDT